MKMYSADSSIIIWLSKINIMKFEERFFQTMINCIQVVAEHTIFISSSSSNDRWIKELFRNDSPPSRESSPEWTMSP